MTHPITHCITRRIPHRPATPLRGSGPAARPAAVALALALALAAALTALAGCGDGGGAASSSAPGAAEWRFAIEETQGSVQDGFAQRFKQLIEEKSGGQITVTVYPYGALGTSDQLTELVRSGTIEFAMASPGHLGKLIPETQVFLLHFIFPEDQRVAQVALGDEALRTTLAGLYEAKGLKLLSIYPEGWMVWTANKPIRTPADFQGVKIRTMTSPLLLAAYEAYGANPTPMAYSEVYSALQLNMVDAQVNPVFAVEEMSFYEVQDYMIFADHALFITTAITSPAFFESLPADRQQMVRQTIAELEDYIFDLQRRYNAERLEIIRENKPDLNIIDDLSEGERQQFREASMPVRDRFVELAGADGGRVLEQLLSAVEDAKAGAPAGDEQASAAAGEDTAAQPVEAP